MTSTAEKEARQMKRAHYETNLNKMRAAEVQTNGKGFRIPVHVILRECKVVIIGSTCKTCGRDFKCESDVNVHTRVRHNATFGSLMDIMDHKIENIGHKCDVCDMLFVTVSELKIHKRLIHKHRLRQRGRRRKEMVRVKFKLNGVITTDVNLDRKYIKMQSSLGYIVDVCTQTSFENERLKRNDDCDENIDLSFPNHVTDKSHMQHGIRPDKAANRYIVGKFASTEGDAIASHTVVVGKSLVEISNTPHKDVILDSEGYEDGYYFASQETTADVFINTVADSMDIRDTKNKLETNKREERNVHSQNKIPFDENKILLAYQPEKSNKMSSKENSIFKENSWSSGSPHYSIRWSDQVAGTKETAGLANSFLNSMEIIINNEKNYGFDGSTTKRLSPPLSRLNRKTESMKENSNVDDDVQEVLRIIRGNTQSDINHESPNRMEREMLVQNATSDTFTLPSRLEPTIRPEKCNIPFANFKPSDYPSLIVTESDYQFLSNSLNTKLGIYLEDLHRYGIRLYNDLPEINNNLEEYAVYAQQDFYETCSQLGQPPYTNGLKTNDNEVAVILD